jgi:small subunit ribosomal protein S2
VPGSAAESSWGVSLAAVALAGLALSSKRFRTVMYNSGGHGMGRGKSGRARISQGKPLCNRLIFKDIMTCTLRMHRKSHPTVEENEAVLKKYLAGTTQLRFAQPIHPRMDDDPLIYDRKDSWKYTAQAQERHQYDNPYYLRKFLEPPQFTKIHAYEFRTPPGYTEASGVKLEELLAAGCQFGHTINHFDQRMFDMVYSDLDGTHIIDLVQTAQRLNEACAYIHDCASKGATVMWVGAKAQASKIVEDAAERTNMPWCSKRWVGGTLTNFKKIREGLEKLDDYELRERGMGQQFDRLMSPFSARQEKVTRLLPLLKRRFEGLRLLRIFKNNYPDIVVVVDEAKERQAIHEAWSIGIPTIALVDTNCNPSKVDKPIPCNASGTASIDLIIGKLVDAYELGRNKWQATPENERPTIEKTWDPWMWSADRRRNTYRRSKRQPYHRERFGSYENWKVANPLGKIPGLPPWFEVDWDYEKGGFFSRRRWQRVPGA